MNRDFVAEARTVVIPDIGQIDVESRDALNKAVRRGDIAKWRGHWYPVAGSSSGIGPLKTCYGPIGCTEHMKRRKTILGKNKTPKRTGPRSARRS